MPKTLAQKKARLPKPQAQQILPPDLALLEQAWQESAAKNPTQPFNLKPGIHLGVSFEDYCMIPAVNFSSLVNAKWSLAHYRYSPPMQDKPYFRFGSLIHCNKLEPEEVEKRYVVLPDREWEEQILAARQVEVDGDPTGKTKQYTTVKATSAYKEKKREFMALHQGKQEVSTDWMENTKGILKSMLVHEDCKEIFASGHPEVTLIGEDADTGLLLKSRCDWLSLQKGCPADLKTADDPFAWTLDKFDYHIQAAFYLYVYELAHKATSPKQRKQFPKPAHDMPFWFIVTEKVRPWTILAAPISQTSLQVGAQEAEYLLARVAQAKASQHYPKVNHVREWSVGQWYKPMNFPLALEAEQRVGVGTAKEVAQKLHEYFLKLKNGQYTR